MFGKNVVRVFWRYDDLKKYMMGFINEFVDKMMAAGK